MDFLAEETAIEEVAPSQAETTSSPMESDQANGKFIFKRTLHDIASLESLGEEEKKKTPIQPATLAETETATATVEEEATAPVAVEKPRSENAPATEEKKEEPEKSSSGEKSRKRKVNMAWAVPPEEDPFSETQDIDFVNVAAPSAAEDGPVVKR